jgi:myxalamid-type polyketide synthase MxaE and MxaD
VRAAAAAAALRRSHHDHRLAVVGATREELADGLDAFLAGERRAAVSSGRRPSAGAPPLAFVFSGMGPQWWGMGRELREREPAFREALERCDAALAPLAPWSLLEELDRDEASSRVGEADLAQVTNFALQVALAELWAQWGIRPDAVVGHSAGEIAAAYVCGALDLDEAVLLAYHRSRLQARATGKGKMLAAAIAGAEAEELVAAHGGAISLAAVNGPASVTLSGDADALAALQASLEARQVFARLLPVVVPYHSDAMDAIEDELLRSLAPLRPRDAEIPFVSVVTGEWTPGSALDAAYWWRNVRQPVLFAAGIERLVDDGYATFLELGPHPVLAASVNECLTGRGAGGTVLGSIRRKEGERAAMLRSLAALYAGGRAVAWEGL